MRLTEGLVDGSVSELSGRNELLCFLLNVIVTMVYREMCGRENKLGSVWMQFGCL